MVNLRNSSLVPAFFCLLCPQLYKEEYYNENMRVYYIFLSCFSRKVFHYTSRKLIYE
jgi:hypothetical protein